LFLQVPPRCTELHYEVELGVVIGKCGKNIPEPLAMSHVGGYALALDMTARNLQSEAKKKGHPWSVAKGFDTFCPVSGLIETEKLSVAALADTRLWLKVDRRVEAEWQHKGHGVPHTPSHQLHISDLYLGGRRHDSHWHP